MFSGKAKVHGMREFIAINDRLRPLLPIAGALGDAARGEKNNRAKVSICLGIRLVGSDPLYFNSLISESIKT